jgi:hypothetical protein
MGLTFHRHWVWRALIAGAACAGAAGCTSTKSPDFSVTGAYLSDEGGSRTLRIVMEGSHENTFALPLKKMNYRVQAGGQTFDIERKADVTLEPGQKLRFELPVTPPTTLNAGDAIAISGSTQYVPGDKLRELLSELGLPLPEASFSGQGVLSPELQSQRLGRLGDRPTRVVGGIRVSGS